MQALQLSAVFPSGGHDIDTGCFNAAVSQNVSKLGNVLADGIKAAGKKFSQIVGKDFPGIHIRRGTKPLHLCPNITSIQRFPAAGDKNCT